MADSPDAAVAAPLTIELGPQKLKRYAQLAAKRSTIEAGLAAEIATLKAGADRKLSPIVAELDAIEAALAPWWAQFKTQFLKGPKKSAEITGCVVGTKLGPKKLVVPANDEEAAIKALVNGRLLTYVKRVLTLDKKAIAAKIEADPNGAVAKLGFKLQQDEKFFIDPAVHSGRK